jgi:hypothetical protein
MFMRSLVRPSLTGLAFGMLLFSVMSARAVMAAPALPQPSADLLPGAIVEIVIDALADNDQPFPNAGIETTFNFASPANKAFTGPLERFVTLVSGPVFGQMLNHRESTLSKVVIEGNQATRLVQIVAAGGETYYYAFRLGLQQSGEYAGMWLTEAVWPLENPDNDKLSL